MPSLPTLPKKPWQSHVTVALALAVLVLGSASLFGLLDWLDLIFPSTLHNAGWYQVLGGCVALLGLGVLLGELTSRTNSAGPALVVIGVGLAELAANLTGNDSVLDAWFVQHTFGGGATLSESMPPYAIYALLLAGAPVLWFALPVSRATRSPALALAGSLLAAVGFATFAGHLLNELASQGQNQPAAGSWGLTASLMDIQMPEMDGYEATREIRRRQNSVRPPRIVALTANALQSDRDQSTAVGMDGFITKPVKLQEIAATIRRLFPPVEK